MNEITLNVKRRETGKRIAKQVRNSGSIPGVYYIKGGEPVSITTDGRAIRPIVYTKDVHIVKLVIDGASEQLDCILKAVTFDPVTDKITHFDLQGFSADTLMNFEVPVRLVGTPIGARDGGVIQHIMHRLHVKCLAKDLPSHIDIDITHLKINQSVHLGELTQENVTFIGNPDLGIVSVSPPRVEETVVPTAAAADATATAATTAATEPELVAQKGKKDEKA